jgi:hypothetical protein
MQAILQKNGRDDLMAQIVAEFRSWPVDGVDLPTLAGIQQHWANLRPQMRILCVSEAPDVPPMWAHYAENHRGAVLHFTRDDAIDTPLHVARKVVYRPDPPRLPPLEDWVLSILKEKPFDLKELFKEYEYIKQSHWAPEREWRIVSYMRPGDTGLFSDFPFDPRELRAIFVGVRMPPEDGAIVKALLKHGLEHVQLFKAVEDQKTLRLRFERCVRTPCGRRHLGLDHLPLSSGTTCGCERSS